MADFANTVSTAVPGLGTPSQRQVSFDNSLASGAGTYTVTFTPGIRKGMARVRTKGSITSPPAAPTTGVTTTSVVVSAVTAAGTYVLEAAMGGIGTANQMIDMIAPFNLDVPATTFTAAVTTAAGQVYVDFEVSGGA